MTAAETPVVICPYCQQPAALVRGREIYPHRLDLWLLRFWLCAPCDAYVGCHKGGNGMEPLGRLADAELRAAKVLAHAAFDPIWKERLERKQILDPKYTKAMARGGRYKKLAGLLGIPRPECHIGMFDVELCRRTVDICATGALSED